MKRQEVPGVGEGMGAQEPTFMTSCITLFPQKVLEFPLRKGHPNVCVQARRGRQRAELGPGPARTPSLLDPLYPWVPGTKWLPTPSLGVPLFTLAVHGMRAWALHLSECQSPHVFNWDGNSNYFIDED